MATTEALEYGVYSTSCEPFSPDDKARAYIEKGICGEAESDRLLFPEGAFIHLQIIVARDEEHASRMTKQALDQLLEQVEEDEPAPATT